MTITDNIVKQEYEKYKNHKYKYIYFLNHTSNEIKEYINNRYTDSTGKESLIRILYNIEIRPICKNCGKPVEFIGKQNLIYRNYCSNECKFAATNMVERHRNGCIKKYGVDNISQLESNKIKKENTFLSHFGVKNNLCRKEVQQTIKEKYGADNISQVDFIKKQKEETCFKHYTVKYYTQSKEYKNYMKNIKNEWVNKILDTKKHNKSFNKSTSEDLLYKILIKKYKNVFRQYKSEIYPFACDFYIKDIDTYIELQGFWTHGKHPFDENNKDDIKELNNWKKLAEKSQFYKCAINVWTYNDILKRQTAKENNLKYIEEFDYKNFSTLKKLNII